MSIWSRIKEWLKKWIKENIIADEPESPAEPLPPDPAPIPPVDPPTPPSDQYTVKMGHRVEKTLKVPCSLSFDIIGVGNDQELPGSSPIHISWGYSDGGDWSGGNPSVGTYSFALRNGKLKVYGLEGFAGEQRTRIDWDISSKYSVRISMSESSTVSRIKLGDEVMSEIEIEADMPEFVVVGYGDPEGRPANYGAVISNIKWEGEEV